MVVKIISVILFALLICAADIAAILYIRKKPKDAEAEEGEAKPVSAKSPDRFQIISMMLALIIGCVIGILIYDRTTTLLNFYRVAIILAVTWAIAITDAKLRLIPNVFTVALFGASLIFHIIDLIYGSFNKETVNQILIYYFAAAVVVLLLLLLLSATTHSGMGAGDIKYLTVLCFAGGIMLLLISLSVALFASLIYGVAIMIIKKKKIRDTIPFGPFVLIGVVACILTGMM